MCFALTLHQRVALLQSKGLACLRPEEGTCINAQVFFDERTGVPEPFQKAVPILKEDVIRDALKVCVYCLLMQDCFVL